MQQNIDTPDMNLFRMEKVSLGFGLLAGIVVAIWLHSLFLGLVAAPAGTFMYSLAIAIRERISRME